MPLAWATSNPGTRRAADCWLPAPMGSSCFSAQSSSRPTCGNFAQQVAPRLRLPEPKALGLSL
eukprot:2201722-Alexandrium_andersonii.AAC.1